MFDHQDRAALCDALDQLRHAVHVFVAHALRGLVEQHQLGLHRQRGGNLQRALAAVGQLHRHSVRELGQAHLFEQLHRPRIQRVERLLAAPERVRRAELPLQSNANVFHHRQMRKHGGDLERADHAAARDLCRLFRGDIGAVEQNRAARGHQEFGQQIEAGRLAGAVRANERMDGPALHTQVDVGHGGKALEGFSQSARFENDVLRHDSLLSPALFMVRMIVNGCCVAKHRGFYRDDYTLLTAPKPAPVLAFRLTGGGYVELRIGAMRIAYPVDTGGVSCPCHRLFSSLKPPPPHPARAPCAPPESSPPPSPQS